MHDSRMLTKIGVTLTLLLVFSCTSFAQEYGLAERLAQVEANNNMILSTLTAHKAALDNIDNRMGRMEAKLDALTKASGVQLAPVQNWAGDPQFAPVGSASLWPTSSSTYMQMPTGYSGYNSGMMTSPRRGIFGGRLRGGILRGGCANGS